MKHSHTGHSLTALLAVGVLSLASISAPAAELAGTVQGAKRPITGSTVTLFAAGTGAPKQLAQGKSDDSGAFSLTYGDAPADSVLYVIAKGGTPKAAAGKGPNDAIGLLAVLGSTPPKRVTVNEFTTVASVWTSAQFLKGDALSGHKLGLRIAARNVPNFVDLETGEWGEAIQGPLNSGQTPTMATFATLADVFAACITRVSDDTCGGAPSLRPRRRRATPRRHANRSGVDRAQFLVQARACLRATRSLLSDRVG